MQSHLVNQPSLEKRCIYVGRYCVKVAPVILIYLPEQIYCPGEAERIALLGYLRMRQRTQCAD